jgi:hypothetical protein
MNAVAEQVSQPATPPRRRSKPLLPVNAVASLLDVSNDAVLRLVEKGSLAWAWNVSVNPKPRRRCLRILPAAVADWMGGRACSLKQAEVFGLLLPEGPVVTSRDLYRVLNISGDQLYGLVKAHQLIPCSTWGRGPKGKARFASVRVIQFFQKRRYCLER